MPSQGDLYDVSDEEQVRPLSISKRQGYAQPRNGVSAISSRQSFKAPANGDNKGSLPPPSISRRGKNVLPQCVSPNDSTNPSSVRYEEPNDAPTPHSDSSAPSMAHQAREETEPFAKRSVYDLRKTFEGVPNNSDRRFAARGSRIPRRQPSGAPQVDEDSTKSAGNVQRSSRPPLHSAGEADDEYPDEGTRMPRHPHFQGSMRNALNKPDQEAPHRSSNAGSSRESLTPISEEAELPSERQDPSPCQSRPPTINYEAYDALHGRRTACIMPGASSRPSPGGTIGFPMDSAATFCRPSRPVSITGEANLQHEGKETRIPRTSCMPNPNSARCEGHGPGGEPAASSKRPTRASFLDNIEDEIEVQNACRPQKDVEEHAPRRSTVASSPRSSRALSANRLEEEVEAQYARRALSEGKQPANEQRSNRGSTASSDRTSRVLHNIEQEVEAEYAHRAAMERKQAEEHQSRRSIVVSPQRSPPTFLTDDIGAEIETEYARRRQKEAEKQQARMESVSSSCRSPRVPGEDYIEEQFEAEYGHCAQRKTEEQQCRKPSVASSRRSSQVPVISIEEVEALYARRAAGYHKQDPEPDGDETATARKLSLSLRPSYRVSAGSSPRSPMSPRYEYQVNQFPAYTASRRSSVRARCDSCSSSQVESNIHPAFRDKPYFSPSSPHHESMAESLDHRRAETRSVSSTNSRKCSTMDSLCSECHDVLKAIRPNVSDRHLECPPNIHPVVVECVLTGTSDDAVTIVRDLHKSIIRYTSRHFYLHAAVRRSAISGRRSGHWYDITTEGLPHSRTCFTSRHYDNKGPGTVQKVFYSPYS
ncbi:hypothetical protein BDV11DRAFT_172252 [Aspergillus similis]